MGSLPKALAWPRQTVWRARSRLLPAEGDRCRRRACPAKRQGCVAAPSLQRPQKRHQVGLLTRAEAHAEALVVEVDNVVQTLGRAVVEVRMVSGVAGVVARRAAALIDRQV